MIPSLLDTPVFTALVPAAGRGLRYDTDAPKQWVAVAGRPLLSWTLERLVSCGAAEIVVALPTDGFAEAVEALSGDPRVRCLMGGASRQESVRRCLEQTEGPEDGLILVHDGVRPAVAEADVRATVAAAAVSGAAILGRPVHDTLKEVSDGRVTRTVDRSALFRAETPQVFRRDLLLRAFAAAERDAFEGTDEASVVERLGDVEIRAVEASAPNPKLTRPDDLELVELLLQKGDSR